MLETEKAKVTLQKLKSPEQICFTIRENSDDLTTESPFFTTLIKEADSLANETEPPSHLVSNRFDGFEMNVDSKDIIPLIQQHQNDFNHSAVTTAIRNYTDVVDTYDCNFAYKGSQYFLDVKFQSLIVLNEKNGFVPIDITSDPNYMKDTNSHLLTYYSFNNTIVWTNHMDSYVSLTIDADVPPEGFAKVVTLIPPGKSWDNMLWPGNENDTIYKFKALITGLDKPVKEGEIVVRYYPQCMNQQMAKSLYSQSGVDMKFPVHLPARYQYICGIQYYNTVVIQAYWNKTVDPLEEVYGESKALNFPNYAFHPEALDNGVIQVIAGKSGVFISYDNAEKRFEDIRNETYYIDTQIIEIINKFDNHRYKAVSYSHNTYVEKDIHILELYDTEHEEFYFFKAKMPLPELIKMAETLR